MAAYAAMMFQENAWSEVQVHVLYAESKFAQRFSFAYDDALRLVLDIVASASAPGAAPKACDYCGWCAKAVTCPALLKPALDAAAARQEPAEADKSLLVPFLDTGAHSSEIKDALTMGAALRMARVVARWCKSVEHHAREMAVKGGQVPAGFEISNRAGKMFVTDTAAAFGLAALPQEDFLKACAVRLNSSVKYKEQVGLIEVAAKFNGVKKAQAKRDLLAKLAPVVKQGSGSVQLKAVGKEEDDETEE